jgi:hypothetical protein
MSRASNSLTVSDVLTTPIKLKYSASYEDSSFEANGIQVLKGYNGPISVTGAVPQTTLNYRSVRHLFYSNYLTGSFPVSASSADNYLQSTAASGSNDADIRYFPTESNAEITIFSIPVEVFGQRISRQSFILSSSAYTLGDDGNGNLREINPVYVPYILSGYFSPDEYFITSSAPYGTHVGNIFYNQGIAVITNPSYQAYFP